MCAATSTASAARSGTPSPATRPLAILRYQRTIVGHLSKPPPFDELRAQHVPEPVVALLRRLLEKNPADRPATPEEVEEAIERLLRGETRETPSETPARGVPDVVPPAPSIAEPVEPAKFLTWTQALTIRGAPWRCAATGPATALGGPAAEVLRQRGALPVGETLRLLDVLAPAVDAARRADDPAAPDLDPARVFLQWTPPPAPAALRAARPAGGGLARVHRGVPRG